MGLLRPPKGATNLMKKTIILLTFFLTACNFPWPGRSVPQPPETIGRVTETPSSGLSFGLPGETEAPSQTDCYFNWASEALPDLSEDFERVLKEVQPQAQGYAEAYGEDCITQDGEVLRFLAMETDFHVTLKVKDLEDKQALGELVEQVLGVLEKFPTNETPGSQSGYLGITFEAKGNEVQLWFKVAEAQSLLEDGMRGEALFDTLNK